MGNYISEDEDHYNPRDARYVDLVRMDLNDLFFCFFLGDLPSVLEILKQRYLNLIIKRYNAENLSHV